MLQILLAVIGMTMAGALGLAMIEQANLQSAMAISREDNRRLDLAADILNKNLVETPASKMVMAPAGQAGTNYYQLPAQLDLIRTNSSGVAFHYCPLAPIDQSNDPSYSPVSTTVSAADGTSYGIKTVNGGVASDSAVINTSVRAMSPVAIITSAIKGSTTPPPCSEVRVVNGKITVPNGLARLITRTAQGASTRQANAGTISYYISQTGTGDKTGRDAGNTAAAESVWKALGDNRPQSANIYITGNVTTGSNFETYVAGSNTLTIVDVDLRLIGNGGTLTRSVAGAWYIMGRVTFQDVSITVATMTASLRSRVLLTGTNRFTITMAGQPAFNIEKNATVESRNGDNIVIYAAASNDGFFRNSGNLTLANSYLSSSGGTPPHYLLTNSGGLTVLDSATIGRSFSGSINRADNPVYTIGTGRMSSSNSVVITGRYGKCQNSFYGDTLNIAPDGAGTNSGIPAENSTNYPPPSQFDTLGTWSAYSDAVERRQRARENFTGSWLCSAT